MASNLQDYHHFDHHDDPHAKVHTRQFNAPFEVMPIVIETAIHKSKYTWDQLIILGMISGVYVTFGGTLSLMVSNGVPDIKASDPGLARLLNGILFPVALIFIMLCGGELFTGNTMFFTVGLIDRKVSFKDLARNWSIVYCANFAGAVIGAYFFTYLTQVFDNEPWLTGVRNIVITKTEKEFGVVFLRGIAANELVNLAIVLTMASEDILSKMAGAWFAIMCFAVIGYEHCVANMFLCTVSIMYGGDRTFWQFLYRNLIPTTLGNIIGGAMLVGGLYYYTYIWRGAHLHHRVKHPDHHDDSHSDDSHSHPVSSSPSIPPSPSVSPSPSVATASRLASSGVTNQRVSLPPPNSNTELHTITISASSSAVDKNK